MLTITKIGTSSSQWGSGGHHQQCVFLDELPADNLPEELSIPQDL